MDRKAFLSVISPSAIRARQEGSPLFPSVRLAQNILETGCKLPSWNNLGGFKVGSGKPNGFWRGAIVNKGSWEVYDGKHVDIIAAFRAYDSIYDFYKDQDLLFLYSRYDRVRASCSPEEQAHMLQACGYATDPTYASKIIVIINGEQLQKFDMSEEEEKLELTEYQKSTLVATLQGLIDRKVISDKSWVEKAKSGTLSLSELTWLNTILLAK